MQGQVGDGTITPVMPFGVSDPRAVQLPGPAVEVESEPPCARLESGDVLCWGTPRGPLPVPMTAITGAQRLVGGGCAMGYINASVCAGYQAATGCYVLSAFGGTCTEACTGLGGCNQAATHAIGGGGTDALCSEVDLAHGGAGNAAAGGDGAAGCATTLLGDIYTGFSWATLRYQGTTTCDAPAPGTRYCACGP